MEGRLLPCHCTCQTHHREGSLGGCVVVSCHDTTHVMPTTGKGNWVDAGLFTALTLHMSDPPLGGITGWMRGCLLPCHCTCQTHHWEGSLGGCRVIYCPDTTHARPSTGRDHWVDARSFTVLKPHMPDPPLGGITGWMRSRLLP